MVNSVNLIERIRMEYDNKNGEIEHFFGEKVDSFSEGNWSESEMIAYDLGFSEALLIVLKILQENGVE